MTQTYFYFTSVGRTLSFGNVAFYRRDKRRLQDGTIGRHISLHVTKLSVEFSLFNYSVFVLQGPVVQKPVNTNPGLKVNRGLCLST